MAIAKMIVTHELGLIEGAREIVIKRYSLPKDDQSDPDLLTFVGFDSECEVFPMGDKRELWDPALLAERDRERDQYLDLAMPSILESCRNLIARWADSKT